MQFVLCRFTSFHWKDIFSYLSSRVGLRVNGCTRGAMVSSSNGETCEPCSNSNRVPVAQNTLENGRSTKAVPTSWYGLNNRVDFAVLWWSAVSLGERKFSIWNRLSMGLESLYCENLLVREPTAAKHNVLRFWPYCPTVNVYWSSMIGLL